MSKPVQCEEEFNNFMHRVTEVNDIVRKLSCDNRELNNMGIAEADRYLNDTGERIVNKIDNETIQLKVTHNRTMINKVKEEKKLNDNEMSPEVFMKEIERDANQRYEDKKVRKEKSDTIKVQANKAFRRGEYEKALCLYDKAIDLIKDSCVLYTNRALTAIQLQLYEKAEKDCDWAVRLNENSLKAYLYMARIAFEKNDMEKYEINIKEAHDRHPKLTEEIESFVTDFKSNKSTEND